jgi:hypothetical protein
MTDFDRKAAGFSPDRVDALVWALTDLLVEEIASWGIYETTRRKAEAVIKARLAAAEAGRPKAEPAPGSLEYQALHPVRPPYAAPQSAKCEFGPNRLRADIPGTSR